MQIVNYMKKMVELKASDLFVTAGMPVAAKINGELLPIDETPLTGEDSLAIVLAAMNEKQKNEFLKGDINEFYYKKAFKTLQSKGLDRVFVVNFNSKYSNEQILSLGSHPMVSLIELVPVYEFFHTPNDFNTSSNN